MDAPVKAERRTSMGHRGAFVTGAIVGTSLLMFVATGGGVAATLVAQAGGGGAVDRTLLIAMLLNVAIIIFARHRHQVLSRTLVQLGDADARANQLATRDPLTGFLNRRSLSEDGATMLARARTRDKAMAMLFIDLDHFKSVNDMHGIAMGDSLLRAVAVEIAALLPAGALAARLGSDEFACALVFDAGHPEMIERLAERLVSRLAQPFRLDSTTIHLSASVGIARSDFDCASGDALLRAADIAMFAAKRAGRGRYAWFDPAMERALQVRNALENGLRSAIPDLEIVPYFEQQIDLTTGHLSGFEVLARWEHPTRGLIGPDEFIPIAEDSGMIGELSLSIMRQAFAAARDWDPSLTLSVNISPMQLRDAWLAQKIIKTLTETGFPAHRLEVEITESSLFDNLALAQSICGSLKNQGIRIALDDFGTGYSSLAHLRALPFDRIKIDKSFVQSIIGNAESAAIVNTIARLGDSLNLPVTAEGVETKAIEERLRAIGCAKAQGYHYGRPLPLAKARQLLAERRLLRFSGDIAPRRLAG
ncbi:putative bifunctional diguanylate cyclase/phosphodiesterase [Sphingomonas sp.]|jgi:diguanylate cyclase (GGDEF)-like protein|uniref:putative bifunctional diguanylate cyclase/phosphodiesterase n=1 Tax=Sphingomonas sp. TaxID=28214 RepID=UPI002ED9A3AC